MKIFFHIDFAFMCTFKKKKSHRLFFKELCNANFYSVRRNYHLLWISVLMLELIKLLISVA